MNNSALQISPHFKFLATGSALGAVVNGIDLRLPLSSSQFKTLSQIWNEHHILIFKGQNLTDEQLFNFATYFGDVFHPPLDVPVLASNTQGVASAVVPVSNQAGGYTGSGELSPHIDHQWTPRPSKASFLYALQVPSIGGDTSWYNLNRAWETLDEETKERISKLTLITYNPFLRQGEPVRPRYRDPANPPKGLSFAHPVVTTHPESGKKILYISKDTEVEIPELSLEEGRILIEKLRAHTFKDEYRYEHQWQVGDIVLWDNRSTAHSRTAFPETEVRDLHRVSLAGQRPL